MRLFLLVVLIATVGFIGIYYYAYRELPVFSLGPSEVCQTIAKKQQTPRIGDGDTSYNDYTDGLKFFLNLCFFRQ